MKSRVEIMVRSVVSDGRRGRYTEWQETVTTWRAAWKLVDDTYVPRNQCKVFSFDGETRNEGHWCISIEPE